MKRKTIRELASNFVIPPGTQVVLKQHITVDANRKKSGSVGVVVKCPPHNEEPYLVRFPDESEILIPFSHLTTRRREIDNILAASEDFDYRQCIVYKCQVGSHAFGLATQDSDTDIRGIFLPPAKQHWSLFDIPQQLESKSGVNDEVYWEFEKFVKLALKANPNILETLWTPKVIYLDPIAEPLRDSRHAFLSSHLYKTYSGYVLSQFRRMKNAYESKGSYKPKHAMHLIRLLYSGIGALRNGEIMIDVSVHREQLLTIKSGAFSFEEVRELALELDNEFQIAFENTELPEQPDFELVNRILVNARRSMA